MKLKEYIRRYFTCMKCPLHTEHLTDFGLKKRYCYGQTHSEKFDKKDLEKCQKIENVLVAVGCIILLVAVIFADALLF